MRVWRLGYPLSVAVRDAQLETIDAYDALTIYDPVPPDVTLVKADDGEYSDVNGLTADTITEIETAMDGEDEFVVCGAPEVADW